MIKCEGKRRDGITPSSFGPNQYYHTTKRNTCFTLTCFCNSIDSIFSLTIAIFFVSDSFAMGYNVSSIDASALTVDGRWGACISSSMDTVFGILFCFW